MSENAAETVREQSKAFSAYMRGDLSVEMYAQRFDPNAEVRWHERTYPDTPELLRGVEEIIDFSERFRAEWADVAAEPLEITESPDGRILVFTRQSGRGRQSGVPIEIHFFELWTVRDGRLKKVEYFRHRADALKAAGLSE
jgi:ketosteroid isomerase-like protein